MPGMDSCLFFKSSLYWLFFKLALTKGSCNVSFGQIAPALQLGVELILTQPWKKPLLTFAFDAKWYILIYRRVGHKKRLPGNGWLMALRKSKQANSLWFCMGGKSKYVFSERISAYWWVTCSMRRGGERSLGSLQHVFQKKKKPPQPGRGRRGKVSTRYREAMSSRCREANSQRAGERGHLCPCRSDYRSATRPVTQCVKARVISRTDNWTLILGDIVVGMICQADRAYVVTSADRQQTKGMFGRSDPGPRRRRARDDTAINQELPSWLPSLKRWSGPCFWGWKA